MLAPLQEGRIWTKRNFASWLVQATLAILVTLLGLYFCFPLAFSQAGTHLWSHTGDPYALGDLGGAIYMVVRTSLGETGCMASTHGVPWAYDICKEIPNPIVTDILGGAVSRMGMPYGYNVFVLAFLVSNGLAVFFTARLFGAKVTWALVGAIVATSAPSIIYEVEGGYVQHIWWGPAIMGFALSVASIRSWAHFPLALFGGLFLGLSVPVYAMIPFMLLPWALMAGVAEFFSSENRRGVLVRSILGAAIASCFVLPQIAGGLESAGPRLFEGDANASTLMLGLEAFTVDDWFGMGVGGADLVRSPGLLLWSCLLFSVIGWRGSIKFAAPLLAGVLMLGLSFGPSMDGGTGAAGFGEALPYSLLMEHLPIARGSMRPTRYGVAAVLLLSIALPIALTYGLQRVSSFKERYHIFLAATFSLILMLQIRPNTISPSLAWPPFPEISNVDGNSIDADEVWLDLPVIGRAEDRFAQWAFNPAPRMNPPHDLGRWRDDVERSDFYLMKSLMAIRRGEEPSESWLRAIELGVPDVLSNGLSRVVVHRGASSPDLEVGWHRVLSLAGAERVFANDRLFIYRF